MEITSAKFIKGIVGTDSILNNSIPQVAFIGRSNVGKSSVINSLTNQKDLARTSSFPGRTQEINIFLINEGLYLIDLPGYGFAKLSREAREKLEKLINWYLFNSNYVQKKVVLIIDANIGLTEIDLETLEALEDKGKDIVVVANKVDKLKKSTYQQQIQQIQNTVSNHKVIPYSSEKKLGIDNLIEEIFNQQK